MYAFPNQRLKISFQKEHGRMHIEPCGWLQVPPPPPTLLTVVPGDLLLLPISDQLLDSLTPWSGDICLATPCSQAPQFSVMVLMTMAKNP